MGDGAVGKSSTGAVAGLVTRGKEPLNRADLGAVAFQLRSNFARRRGGYIALALVVGLVGGTAMASVAAARRTQSSFSTFLAGTDASGLIINEFATGSRPVSLAFSARTEAEVAHLPGVKHVETAVIANLFPLMPSGAPVVDPTTLQSVFSAVSADGMFFNQDRVVVTEGRMARPARPDEIVMTALAAQLLKLHVGQTVAVGIYTNRQESLPAFGTPRVRPVHRADVKLVGLVQMSTGLVEDDIDRLPTLAFFTPAFYRDVVAPAGPMAEAAITMGLQLEPGASVARVERGFAGLAARGAGYEFHLAAPVAAKVNLSVKPLAIALAVFGLVAALAALVIAGLMLVRLQRDLDDEHSVLRALGAPTGVILADGLVAALAAVAAGALLAAVVAVALSPLSPLGPVRPVFPGPWLSFDWTVLAAGIAVFIAGPGATAVAVAYRRAPHRVARRARLAPARPSRVASVAAAAGLPVAASVGVRFALEPGRGRSAVPVRSVLFGGIVAVTLVVATLTFGSSLQLLVSHPSLYGWDWTYMLNPTDEVPRDAFPLLDKDREVAAWTGYDYNEAYLDGIGVPVLFEGSGRPGQAPIVPPILSGHAVDAKDQVVLGAATMAELHTHVGGTLFVSYGSPGGGRLYIAPERLTVVGTATMPAVGFVSFVADHTSMGTGALLSEAAIPTSFSNATANPYPQLQGTDLVFVRMKKGVSPAAGMANLQKVAQAADKILASAPDGAGQGQYVTVEGVQRPAQIVNYKGMGSAPLVLAAAVAGGALTALALMLAASVRRRRHDLAVLRTLGFTSRQLASAVAWQASVTGAVGAAAGAVAGVAAGRWLWTLFAHQIYAVPDASVPLLAIAVTALGALVLANLVALPPGRSAARAAAATLLRLE